MEKGLSPRGGFYTQATRAMSLAPTMGSSLKRPNIHRSF